jgi:hypothetical protein
MGNMIALALLMGLLAGTMGLAGHIAERRGRSFRTWALIASVIGPFAFPLVYLFPNLRRRNGDHG